VSLANPISTNKEGTCRLIPTIAFARLEATMREIERVQTELRSEQTWLKWMAGSVVAVMLAGTGIGLSRSFVLSDRLADVQVDTAAIRVIVEKDVTAIRSDVEKMRADIQRVGDAVRAKLEEKKAEFPPR
jgi:hypothetical protein